MGNFSYGGSVNSMTPPDSPVASPEWLERRRSETADRVGTPTLPSTDEEVWRYSRVGDLDLDQWEPVPEPVDRTVPAAVTEVLDAVGDRAATVVVRNGWVVRAEVAPVWADRGVFVGRLVDGPGAQSSLGAVAGEGVDVFGQLNDIHLSEPVLVSVPAGLTVDAPIVLVDWVDADGAAVYPRTVVRLGADAEARVLEWAGSDDVGALVAPVVELELERASRLGFGSVQSRSQRIWQIASQVSRVDADATLTSSQIALGSEYGRSRTDCRLIGRGATGNLHAVYFGVGDQTLDFRTFQKHEAPDTTSNLLFKGAVDDRSRSIYTGLIKVDPEARGTNAFQTNRNLKLSESAWAESVPNLEIETNDVRCSHASTVGPVDPEQIFYLESRGVPPETAERLIVAGFFDEVLESFPVPAIVPLVTEMIAGRLGEGSN